MAPLKKILNSFGLSLDEEAENEEIEEELPKVKTARVEPTVKAKPIISQNTTSDDYIDHEELSDMLSTTRSVILIQPSKLIDAKLISDELKAGKTVIVNVDRLHADDVTRLNDFITGATHALGGKIKEASETVTILAPKEVRLQITEDSKKTASEQSFDYDDYDDGDEYLNNNF